MAVLDVTSESGCALTSTTFDAGIDSAVVDEQSLPCPQGSVIRAFPADAQTANAVGAIFVPLTGTLDVDLATVDTARQELMLQEGPSYSQSVASTMGRTDRGFQASLSYYAYNPGVTVYSTAYYAQDDTCATWITSAAASLSWDADLYWRQAGCHTPVSVRSHGCPNLSTGSTWHSYNWAVNGTGGTYWDESINNAAFGCSGWGDSYTGSRIL